MGLSLVVGPAHSGKIARVLEHFLERLDDGPWLLVPNRVDVERVERELLARRGGLLSGRVATFDDLFARLVPDGRPVLGDAERAIVLRRAIRETGLTSLAGSARSAGFVDTLGATLAELDAGLVDAGDLDGDLAALASGYREELERLEAWDRAGLRRAAVERLATSFDAWDGAPVLAYGFEDFTAAEWAVLEQLAARTEVVVSLPYETGRVAFAALERTVADLAGLADGRVEDLAPAAEQHLPAALARVERGLFESERATRGSLDPSLRWLEGAGARGTIELVADEIAALLRSGMPAHEIAIVCESTDRWRAVIETVLGGLEIPYAVEEPSPLPRVPFGAALVGALRFAWLDGSRGDVFRYLRSPFSGLQRATVDFVEGRLRGRAVREPARVEEELEKLRGGTLPLVAQLREPGRPTVRARAAVTAMLTAAYGLEAPPLGADAALDLRAAEAVLRTLDGLESLEARGVELGPDDVVAALERTRVASPNVRERGRVCVLDLARARTRRFDAVFVLGLEEGVLPRRSAGSPLLGDDLRAALGRRLERPDPVARDRYLFYTACTRPRTRLSLVREAASDEGVPREASPFWSEVTALFPEDEVARATRRRPLSASTWPLDQAPSERERLRALVRASVEDRDEAEALARANGWERKLARAASAWSKPTRITSPAVLGSFGGRTSFGVTELERFADCSSAWLVERVIDPKTIDAEPDALLRGSIAHTALHRFSQAIPRELGVERVADADVEQAVEVMRRCLDEALASGARIDLTELQRAELRQTLLRDLEGVVRDEAAAEGSFVPRRFELSFGSERAAPELQRGLALGDDVTLSGKIDRVDVDPFSARGIVQDYKSGRAPSAAEIDRELRLQIPLYLLVLRDLAGIEPIGGVYRSLSGRRPTRGILRESAAEDLPGYAKADYLDEDAFWAQVETARERALDYAGRIRTGDVRHDPKGDGCPSWCDLWTICRVSRA